MATGAVVIVGIGMSTPVGLSAPETAASVRAGTARFAESSFFDKNFVPFTLAQVPDDGLLELAPSLGGLPEGTERERRMLRLAASALRECLGPLRGQSTAVPVCLALPESEGKTPLDRLAFVTHLAAQSGGALDPQGTDASHLGRAGGVVAIAQAMVTVESGLAEFAVAGGIDSYRDPYVLAILDQEQRVKSESNWDGFVPGEAAEFVLLTTRRHASTRGLPVLAALSDPAMGFESGHLYSPEPYRGDGLAATLQQLVAQRAEPTPIAEVYASMSGESHWAKEWGVAFLRNREAFREDHRMHHPADCFGDTGAASGPLLVGLASLGISGRYRRSPALAYGSSDRGPRAAVIVSAVEA